MRETVSTTNIRQELSRVRLARDTPSQRSNTKGLLEHGRKMGRKTRKDLERRVEENSDHGGLMFAM